MRLGMVGLGKMGANMTRRVMRGGHELVVTDLSADNVKKMAGEGGFGGMVSMGPSDCLLSPAQTPLPAACTGAGLGWLWVALGGWEGDPAKPLGPRDCE